MDYPTKLYPLPPKPEWFMTAPTSVHTIRVDSQTPGVTKQRLSEPAGAAAYVKMDSAQYESYLLAHEKWLGRVEDTKQRLHDEALARRAYAKVTEEVIGTFNAKTMKMSPGVPSQRTGHHAAVMNRSGTDESLVIQTRMKAPHPDPGSQKTEAVRLRESKRAKRKAVKDLRAARLNTEAEAAAALASELTHLVVAPDTPARTTRINTISSVLKQVDSLRLSAPLHKAELAAAKSAAARSRTIVFGSPDLVANVDANDGWKVVTRKKGAFMPILGAIEEVRGGETVTASSSKDPSVPSNMVPLSTVRKPTSTASK